MIITWLKDCWKIVVTIIGAIGIISILVTFTSQYATSGDLDKVKAEAAVNLEKAKIETKAIIVEFKKSMDLERDITRLNSINDSLIKAKIQQRNYPKDKDIAEDVEQLKKDKAILQERIEKR